MKGSEGHREEENSPSRGLSTEKVPRTQDIRLVGWGECDGFYFENVD